MRLLLAEDERDLNKILTKKLISEGYSVDSCTDGKEALYCLENADYDGAILDIMLPGMDGLSIVRTLRKQGKKVPVLFLTARDSMEDRVMGLDAGAEDYLVKPFFMEELLARVRVLIRKSAGVSTNYYQVADLVLDIAGRRAKRGEREIKLSVREFSVLEYLMRNAGIVLSREQIEEHMWSFDNEGGSNVVDVYIRYLRKKIDDDFEKKLIHTVRGAGYVMREEM